MPRKSASTKMPAHRLPVMPLRDAVIFPQMVVPLLVGRAASIAAVEESLAEEKPLFLCTQIEAGDETPTAKGMYRVGTAARILQTLRLPDNTLKIVVEGVGRGKVQRFYLSGEVPEADVEELPAQAGPEKDTTALLRTVTDQFEAYVRSSQRITPEILVSVQAMDDAELFADTVCAYLNVRTEERQELLEESDLTERLEHIVKILIRENELVEIEKGVRERVREQMERGQREHYLQEQLRAIHQELGQRGEDGGDEYTELREMVAKAKMPKEIRERAEKECARYERMPMLSPESAVIRTYLEWLCELPWSKRTRDIIDLKVAREVLDADHYGLEKVKERILEFLAVRKLSRQTKGPILCLVGPPGVGKTSLGESIASAMKRKFVRISLGGVRDEAEIRGHRRTYIGALPGRIIQSLKKAGVRNPVFMLDEIDKMNSDFRGDPASALLEVLDPAQNKAFSDHYMEIDVDLSEVFFIATANNEFDIPYALQDRLEVIRLSGYTLHEKSEIATRFLLPRQLKGTGLSEEQVALTEEGLDFIVQRYTREAGVRELERQLASVCRKVARRVVDDELNGPMTIDAATAQELLGPPPYSAIRSEVEARTGVAIGMAWTQVGGDVLTVESTVMPGKGKLTLTGKLGDVMKESAEAAYTWLRANAEALGIESTRFKENDVHVHVPEGAIPKDGPSAGNALVVSMLSALRGVAPKGGLSMTGEITLRGRVLPVGGIKEKVLAAHRAGVRQIILPRENEKDLPDIPEEVRSDMVFELVDEVNEVLRIAFGPDAGIATKH